jgi:hypothetical protein
MLLSRLKDNPLIKWLHLGRWKQTGYSLPVILRACSAFCEYCGKRFEEPMNR